MVIHSVVLEVFTHIIHIVAYMKNVCAWNFISGSDFNLCQLYVLFSLSFLVVRMEGKLLEHFLATRAKQHKQTSFEVMLLQLSTMLEGKKIY